MSVTLSLYLPFSSSFYSSLFIFISISLLPLSLPLCLPHSRADRVILTLLTLPSPLPSMFISVPLSLLFVSLLPSLSLLYLYHFRSVQLSISIEIPSLPEAESFLFDVSESPWLFHFHFVVSVNSVYRRHCWR